ncbi:hypothetical protein TTRE_0000941701 [Trichuris trichiura]|uniref:Uncharacterized protein n=1 Tax=Trichuris trichiura TaxID=36087 RepID=A0A077ZKY9_TRITR|nr:hypothetical protein TTRE_0000941701 [Trichuris trichiura]
MLAHGSTTSCGGRSVLFSWIRCVVSFAGVLAGCWALVACLVDFAGQARLPRVSDVVVVSSRCSLSTIGVTSLPRSYFAATPAGKHRLPRRPYQCASECAFTLHVVTSRLEIKKKLLEQCNNRQSLNKSQCCSCSSDHNTSIGESVVRGALCCPTAVSPVGRLVFPPPSQHVVRAGRRRCRQQAAAWLQVETGRAYQPVYRQPCNNSDATYRRQSIGKILT